MFSIDTFTLTLIVSIMTLFVRPCYNKGEAISFANNKLQVGKLRRASLQIYEVESFNLFQGILLFRPVSINAKKIQASTKVIVKMLS